MGKKKDSKKLKKLYGEETFKTFKKEKDTTKKGDSDKAENTEKTEEFGNAHGFVNNYINGIAVGHRYDELIRKCDEEVADDLMDADVTLGRMIYNKDIVEKINNSNKVKECICNIVERYERDENTLIGLVGILSAALLITGLSKRKK